MGLKYKSIFLFLIFTFIFSTHQSMGGEYEVTGILIGNSSLDGYRATFNFSDANKKFYILSGEIGHGFNRFKIQMSENSELYEFAVDFSTRPSPFFHNRFRFFTDPQLLSRSFGKKNEKIESWKIQTAVVIENLVISGQTNCDIKTWNWLVLADVPLGSREARTCHFKFKLRYPGEATPNEIFNFYSILADRISWEIL